MDLVEASDLRIKIRTSVVVTDRHGAGRFIDLLREFDTQGIAHPDKYRPVILHLIFQHDPVLVDHPVIRAAGSFPGKTDRDLFERILAFKIYVPKFPRRGIHNMRVSPEHGPVALDDREDHTVLKECRDTILIRHRSYEVAALFLNLQTRFDINGRDQLFILVPEPLDPVAFLLDKTRERKVTRMLVVKFINLFEVVAARGDRDLLCRIIIDITKFIAGIQVPIKNNPGLVIIRLFVMNFIRRVITLSNA